MDAQKVLQIDLGFDDMIENIKRVVVAYLIGVELF